MTFYTAVNCMDGRVQTPIIEYLRKRHGVSYVDVVTEPGPVRFLAGAADDAVALSVERRVEISLTAHSSSGIAVVAHADCAGNPLSRSEQLEQLRTAVARLRSRFPGVPVAGLWLGEGWTVEEALPAVAE